MCIEYIHQQQSRWQLVKELHFTVEIEYTHTHTHRYLHPMKIVSDKKKMKKIHIDSNCGSCSIQKKKKKKHRNDQIYYHH